MVTNQFLASGGLWLNLSGTQILVDPGPGCIVQSTKRRLKADKLDAIIISHRHIDHSADVNIMIEAMTRGGLKPRGRLFAPADALEDEPIIFNYLRKSLDGIDVLQEGKSYTVGSVSWTTPIRHLHPVETYGMRFTVEDYSFSYIADSRYFDGLINSYGGELLIINVVFVEPRTPAQSPAGLPVDHLSVPDAQRIITELRPKVAIITHFGMNLWRARPWQVAEQLSEETGIKVIAARDGMKFDLSSLVGG